MIPSLLLSALLMGSAQAGMVFPRQQSCPNVHIIVARASGEKPGTGLIGAVANQVANATNGTTIEAIVYPATIANYPSSSAQGTSAMVTSLRTIVNQCENTKVVLMGYSQGAQVVGDTVCGGGGIGANSSVNAAIDSKYSDKIAAMIIMGDPRFMPNMSSDVGSNRATQGIFPRPTNQSCDKYMSKIQSYCDNGDPFCARGNNLTVHLGYVKEFGSVAANFTGNKLKAASSSGSISAASALDAPVKTAALLIPLALLFATL